MTTEEEESLVKFYELDDDEKKKIQESLGKFYDISDNTIGNIIEFLNSSEVKDLRCVSRYLKKLADNEDDSTRNPKRPRHANLAMLKYKMLDEERIEKIIKNSPFPFPPNCYYQEDVMSKDNKLFIYSNYVILGPSINLFIEKNPPFYNFKLNRTSVYQDSIYTKAIYFFQGSQGFQGSRTDYNLKGYEIAYPLSDPYNEYIDPVREEETIKNIKKYVYILKKSINEDFTFIIPLKENDRYLYNKINIRKIS